MQYFFSSMTQQEEQYNAVKILKPSIVNYPMLCNTWAWWDKTSV